MGFEIGYIYATEADAMDAVARVNAHYGVPVDGGVTTDWVEYHQRGDEWVIIYDDSLNVVLGNPVVLPVIDE